TLFDADTAIGVLTSAGQESDDLLLEFNANASVDIVSALLNALVYVGTDVGSHDFTLVLSDAAAGETTGISANQEFTLQIAPPEPDLVIDDERAIGGVIGNVQVTQNGVLQGDTINGDVYSEGLV